MFLDFIKTFFVKKTLRKNSNNVRRNQGNTTVKTVGLLIDGSLFCKNEALLKELISNGINQNAIKLLVYKDKAKIKIDPLDSTFGFNAFDCLGNIIVPVVNEFVNEEFDLLISYYAVEKPLLLMITQKSKAKFKAGFFSIDKQLNDFMINTTTEDYKVFTFELFKYLKILNKI